MGCGDTDSWFNFGGSTTNNIDQYSCSSWDESAPEYTYSFRPEASEAVTICLSNMDEDLDIFVVEESGGCDGNNCVDYGNTCATVDVVAGQTYYLVVDGYQGATGAYDIEVTCPSTSEICDNGIDDDGDSTTDCEDTDCQDQVECTELCEELYTLSCGSSDTDNTIFGWNDVNTYSCTPWLENGPEIAYYFQAPHDEANLVNVALSYDWSLDLDVFILGDQGVPCDSQACVEYGAITTDFETIPGADYWIVVDGYHGDAGQYSISVSCAPLGGENCNNLVDDDADGLVDCDDDQCAQSPLCASECVPFTTISCDEIVTGDTSDTSPGSGVTNQIGGYPCSVGNYEGSEIAYEWVSTTTGTVSWALIDPSPTEVNHDLFVLDGENGECFNTQCLEEGGFGFNVAEFEAVAGYTYYLVVDGFAGDVGAFAATLDCSPDD